MILFNKVKFIEKYFKNFLFRFLLFIEFWLFSINKIFLFIRKKVIIYILYYFFYIIFEINFFILSYIF